MSPNIILWGYSYALTTEHNGKVTHLEKEKHFFPDLLSHNLGQITQSLSNKTLLLLFFHAGWCLVKEVSFSGLHVPSWGHMIMFWPVRFKQAYRDDHLNGD